MYITFVRGLFQLQPPSHANPRPLQPHIQNKSGTLIPNEAFHTYISRKRGIDWTRPEDVQLSVSIALVAPLGAARDRRIGASVRVINEARKKEGP
jgi:hypothetical protein